MNYGNLPLPFKSIFNEHRDLPIVVKIFLATVTDIHFLTRRKSESTPAPMAVNHITKNGRALRNPF